MGRRISFSMQEALANPEVTASIGTEVLPGDPEAEPGSIGARDSHCTTIYLCIKNLTQGFDLNFDPKGQPQCSRDFNSWSESHAALQTFIDVLGVTYHVY